MSDSNDNRKWLVLIALGALLVLLWDGPNLFHFHWKLPFWPVVTVIFAIWWMSGGKHRLRDESDETEHAAEDVADASEDSAGENDEETANKA